MKTPETLTIPELLKRLQTANEDLQKGMNSLPEPGEFKDAIVTLGTAIMTLPGKEKEQLCDWYLEQLDNCACIFSAYTEMINGVKLALTEMKKAGYQVPTSNTDQIH